jgi:hypothetical protein
MPTLLENQIRSLIDQHGALDLLTNVVAESDIVPLNDREVARLAIVLGIIAEWIERYHRPLPYPFCRHPDDCRGRGYCRHDPACND